MIEILFLIAVAYIIYCVFRMLHNDIKLHKIHKAMSELHEMPIDEWEAKWAEYVQEEYNKLDDPHREEVESDMEFFRKCREESKEGDEQ